MAKLLQETEEKIFFGEQAALEFFKEQEKREIWKHCYTNELSVFPVPGLTCGLYDPASVRQDCGMDEKKVSDESVEETLNSTKIGLSIPLSKMENYPVATSAFSTLMQRAGYSTSPVIANSKGKQNQKEMPPDNKAKVLNMGLNCFSNKALVLIRDEKVRAVLSGDENDYSRLPVSKLYKALESTLGSMFPDWSFEMATVSHLYTTILIRLNDKKIEREIQETFAKAGIKENGQPMIRIVTSDVGLSGANIFPVLRDGLGKEKAIGIPLTLTHNNGHTTLDFANNVMQVAAMFRDAKAKLEEMMNKRIHHPAGCLKVIGKKCQLPKKLVCNEAPLFESTYVKCYEIDVYYKLFDILDDYLQETSVSASRMVEMQESIARVAFTNMSDYDYEFDWE